MKKFNTIVSLILISIICLSGKAQQSMEMQKMNTVLYCINNYYVDSTDLDKLVEVAITSMLKDLDPHSAYISKEDLNEANEALYGSFEGIGVTYQLVRDTILIVSPIPGGPSDKVGILAGDKIIKINKEDAFGKKVTTKFVQDRLRGKKGSKVNVSIKRGKSNKLINYTIVRDKIPINSIDATFMVDKGIGYIKLNRFSKTSMDEFHQACEELSSEGMKSMILDLRGNSGGFLDVAVKLSDEFLERNKLIVYTEGLKSPRQEFHSTSIGEFEKGNLVILIDESTASASEIVSGAVQDWDRGIIIGRRSFGKGLVQRPLNLPDGSVIRLTTSRYYTPTGRCIQRPYEDGVESYYKDLYDRQEKGELVNSDSIHFPDSLKYLTPGKRVVYGGGGIMPDIFVPADTTHFSTYYSNLIRKSIFNKYTIDYATDNRKLLKDKYSDFNKFNKNFFVDQKMKDDFIALAEKEDVEMNEEQYKRSEEYIWLQVKALIARNVWEEETYYQVIASKDEPLIQAVELLKNKKKLATIMNH